MMKTIKIDEDVYNELNELAVALKASISGLASNILRASIAEARHEVERAKAELNPLLGPAETTVEKGRTDDWLWLLGILGVALFLAARKKRGGEYEARR